MELKDVILSTLAELEDTSSFPDDTQVSNQEVKASVKEDLIHPDKTVLEEEIKSFVKEQPSLQVVAEEKSEPADTRSDEVRMLEGIRERLLVLFEGFQSPNNVQLEAKVDLTLNFLEYLLAMIDNRLDSIKED